MPHLHLIVGSGTAVRNLLETTVRELESQDYELSCRQEGGEWRSLLTENRGGGLFGERSFIVVEDAEKLGGMPEELAPLLEPAGSSVVILLVLKAETPQIVPKTLLDRCSKTKTKEAPPPWSRDRDDAIREVVKAGGVKINNDALMLLKELYDDVGELVSETAKLVAYCDLKGQGQITAADVESLCLSDGSRVVMKILDSLCARRQIECLANLERAAQGEELLRVLSAIYNRMRPAYYYASHRPQERGAFTRALGVSSYASRFAEQAASLYGVDRLQKLLLGIVDINSNEKSGQGAAWKDLTVLIINLMSDESAG